VRPGTAANTLFHVKVVTCKDLRERLVVHRKPRFSRLLGGTPSWGPKDVAVFRVSPFKVADVTFRGYQDGFHTEADALLKRIGEPNFACVEIIVR
jgi:hypothetical protein